MTRVVALGLLAALAVSSLSAVAGEKCCGEKKAAMEKRCSTAWCVRKITNLTAEQKTAIEAAQAECLKGGCTKECTDKCLEAIKKVLTPEQQEQLAAACKAKEAKMAAKSSCAGESKK